MKIIIYMLIAERRGPGGHGEPGQPYLVLHENGNGYTSTGQPSPAFATAELAETFKADNDVYSDYVVTPVSLEGVQLPGGVL